MKIREDIDYVKIASYMFINEYRKRSRHNPQGVFYNKFMTILHRDLKKEGINIRLPHCWYRWGDVVVRYCVPYIDWTHDDLEMTKVSFNEDRPEFDVKDKVVIRFKEYIDDFFNEYGCNKENVELIIDDVYSEAPFRFQNDFRKLRESLKIGKKQMPYENSEEYILSLLEETKRSFPMQFREIKQLFDDFTVVFTEAVRNGTRIPYLFEIAEDFWFFFCYHLRLNPKCHENVPSSTLAYWRGVLREEGERYEKSIQNYAAEFCHDFNDKIVLSLLKKRERRLSELRRLLDELEL